LSFNRDLAHCRRAFDMSNKYYLLTYFHHIRLDIQKRSFNNSAFPVNKRQVYATVKHRKTLSRRRAEQMSLWWQVTDWPGRHKSSVIDHSSSLYLVTNHRSQNNTAGDAAVGSGKSQRVAAVSVTVSHTVGQLTLPRYSVLTTLLPTHAARRYPLQHYL